MKKVVQLFEEHERKPLSPLVKIRYDFYGLCLLPDRLLEPLMLDGVMPDIDSLVGWEFDGFNTADLTGLVRIRKFKKGFFQDPIASVGEAAGYNVQVKQNPLYEDWIPLLRHGKPIRHSYFRVYPVRAGEPDNKYPNALLLNYESPRTNVWNPARTLRDYLVQVYPDNPDLLLGKAYIAIAGRRIFVSYFVLRRSNRSQ